MLNYIILFPKTLVLSLQKKKLKLNALFGLKKKFINERKYKLFQCCGFT